MYPLIKSHLKTKPSKALLLFFTGFFLAQVLLTNFLYAQHPLGGWETTLGNITTAKLLPTFIVLLSLCLIALWRSVSITSTTTHTEAQAI